ncbi:hypothetical protein ANCDUO_07474 [Ancylostoma duodenale]|uniref:Uncharacterized protein n=1 Tax=Ancylostoma duodenale TaxID=51022 RepID=A0A0C2GTB7_9BILA|nr:hypothetical protein ANCDUO_07474 [Ancylostoma duodenale]
MSIVQDTVPYNDPKVTQLPLISCMGIGTAEGFAKAVRQVFQKKLISDRVWDLLSHPTATEEDIVLSSIKSFGHGFTYEPHPTHEGNLKVTVVAETIRGNRVATFCMAMCPLDQEWIIRIVGNGLQVIELDRKEEVIIVMLRNGLRAGNDGAAEYEEISRTIYQIVKRNT